MPPSEDDGVDEDDEEWEKQVLLYHHGHAYSELDLKSMYKAGARQQRRPPLPYPRYPQQQAPPLPYPSPPSPEDPHTPLNRHPPLPYSVRQEKVHGSPASTAWLPRHMPSQVGSGSGYAYGRSEPDLNSMRSKGDIMPRLMAGPQPHFRQHVQGAHDHCPPIGSAPGSSPGEGRGPRESPPFKDIMVGSARLNSSDQHPGAPSRSLTDPQTAPQATLPPREPGVLSNNDNPLGYTSEPDLPHRENTPVTQSHTSPLASASFVHQAQTPTLAQSCTRQMPGASLTRARNAEMAGSLARLALASPPPDARGKHDPLAQTGQIG